VDSNGKLLKRDFVNGRDWLYDAERGVKGTIGSAYCGVVIQYALPKKRKVLNLNMGASLGLEGFF
jgi:hypothetical protein